MKNANQRIAIIQVDRTELLLFSLPAIRSAIRANPEAEIHFFFNRNASDLINALVPDEIKSIAIDANAMGINSISQEYTEEYKHLYNFSRSAEGLILSSALNTQRRTGLYLDRESGSVTGSDQWCTYFEGVVGKTNFNPFHLCDIYPKIGALSNRDIEYVLEPIEGFQTENSTLQEIFDRQSVKIIVNASSLDTEHLSVALNTILSSFGNIDFILAGTLRSKAQAQTLLSSISKNFHSRVFDLCGQTTLAELAELTRRADLIISKNSLITQLGAGYGTLVFTICKPGANLVECAPYGHGHLLFEPQSTSEGPAVVSAVQSCIEYLFDRQKSDPPLPNEWQVHLEKLISSHLGKVRVFLTQRLALEGPAGEDVELVLSPLLFAGYSYGDTLRRFYRLLWNLELDARGDVVEYIEILEADTIVELTTLLKPLQQLGELSAFGIRYCSMTSSYLRKNDIKAAKESASRLQELDDTIESLASSTPELIPIKNYFSLQQQKIQETDAVKSARAIEDCYRNLQNQVLILLELINELFQQESSHARERTLV